MWHLVIQAGKQPHYCCPRDIRWKVVRAYVRHTLRLQKDRRADTKKGKKREVEGEKGGDDLARLISPKPPRSHFSLARLKPPITRTHTLTTHPPARISPMPPPPLNARFLPFSIRQSVRASACIFPSSPWGRRRKREEAVRSAPYFNERESERARESERRRERRGRRARTFGIISCGRRYRRSGAGMVRDFLLRHWRCARPTTLQPFQKQPELRS